jgi:hypothetical protein
LIRKKIIDPVNWLLTLGFVSHESVNLLDGTVVGGDNETVVVHVEDKVLTLHDKKTQSMIWYTVSYDGMARNFNSQFIDVSFFAQYGINVEYRRAYEKKNNDVNPKKWTHHDGQTNETNISAVWVF